MVLGTYSYSRTCEAITFILRIDNGVPFCSAQYFLLYLHACYPFSINNYSKKRLLNVLLPFLLPYFKWRVRTGTFIAPFRTADGFLVVLH